MSTWSKTSRAASSKQVKQQVVQLLIGTKKSRQGAGPHHKLDASLYSFSDLRKAYLERIQEIHPDKIYKDTEDVDELRYRFQELQQAWEQYEDLAKNMRAVGNGAEDANFTMFGVGCSFSDTEEERELRNEITEQACKGWLSSGLLETSTKAGGRSSNRSISVKPLSLVDDDLFVDSSQVEENPGQSREDEKPIRKNLIPRVR